MSDIFEKIQEEQDEDKEYAFNYLDLFNLKAEKRCRAIEYAYAHPDIAAKNILELIILGNYGVVPMFCGDQIIRYLKTIRGPLYLSLANEFEKNVPLVCPKEGSFIAYKKALCPPKREGEQFALSYCMVTLEIPANAKRSSAFGRKCRCSKAKTLSVVDMVTGENMNCALSYYNPNKIYTVGEEFYPDSFDEDRWVECGHGIHFFMTEEEARNYIL